eukprot:355099-Prorocentrum_minimum.AAC.1
MTGCPRDGCARLVLPAEGSHATKRDYTMFLFCLFVCLFVQPPSSPLATPHQPPIRAPVSPHPTRLTSLPPLGRATGGGVGTYHAGGGRAYQAAADKPHAALAHHLCGAPAAGNPGAAELHEHIRYLIDASPCSS